MENLAIAAAERPAIYMSAAECDALFELALSTERSQPMVCAMLMAELDRAELRDADELPDQTVVMNSFIDFVDERTGARRIVQLVYPQDADIADGRVSILTPIGAGLIGMTAGCSICWPDRSGDDRILRIISVAPPG
ncbi:MAG: nucleoside diphosphate kinase regulator [Blastomonas fulva]|jgi:regulator of nucleoside diphosphate kinase|uniref:Transcription elongation factor GreAB n=1 Tax=Blastomonas fulva TaxID=1550728 RepID=A0ABN5B9F9_9SPHN|nr:MULTISPECIES: nucleoside diphosphate kinase regulator [Blastomonas]ASR52434.1 transcription elongation factor GreAB [Blastomonas fulva]KPF73871.1 transcription elongation factor GreAB [Blastomonas sp. AAP25]MCO5792052.1 nucleoside diphosphate kinase regulator [Blastomonas sp.]